MLLIVQYRLIISASQYRQSGSRREIHCETIKVGYLGILFSGSFEVKILLENRNQTVAQSYSLRFKATVLSVVNLAVRLADTRHTTRCFCCRKHYQDPIYSVGNLERCHSYSPRKAAWLHRTDVRPFADTLHIHSCAFLQVCL